MRTKKAFLNLIANLGLQVVNAVFGLILPRLFISVYGSAVNGLVTSIRLFVYFLNIVEAGIGLASITALLKPIASNDQKEINRVVSAAKILYIRAGYIFLSLVAVLAIIYPLIVKDEISFLVAFFLVLIFGISSAVDFFIIGKYRVLLTADQKAYVLTTIQIIGTVLNAISYIMLIQMGWNLLLVTGISSFLFAARFILVITYIRKAYPQVTYTEVPNTSALKKRWDVLVHQLAGVVLFNAPVMLIAVFLGLKDVSVFTTFNVIFSGLTMMVTAFSSALFAGIGDLLVRDQKEKATQVFRVFEFIYYAMVAWTYSTAYVLIMPFIKIYTRDFHDANYVQPALGLLFVLAGITSNIRIPSYTLFTSAGHFKETRNGAVMEVAVYLAVSLLLIRMLGIKGVLIAGVISAAYRTIDCIVYAAQNLLKVPVKPTLYKLIINFSLSVIAVLPIQLFNQNDPKTLFAWFVQASVVGLWNLCILLTGNFLLDREMWRKLLLKLRFILSKKGKVKLEV
jgi:O-antigen/teichoic acid export membrane protein